MPTTVASTEYGSRSVRHAHRPTPRTRSGRAGATSSGAAMCSSRFPFGMFHWAPGDVPGFDALIPRKPARDRAAGRRHVVRRPRTAAGRTDHPDGPPLAGQFVDPRVVDDLRQATNGA